MPRQILAWQCKYCGAVKKTEKIASRHEKSCTSNPEARNCLLCEHSYKPEADANNPNPKLRCAVRNCDCSRAVSAECPVFKRRKDGGADNEI